jgi:hypothetical protein
MLTFHQHLISTSHTNCRLQRHGPRYYSRMFSPLIYYGNSSFRTLLSQTPTYYAYRFTNKTSHSQWIAQLKAALCARSSLLLRKDSGLTYGLWMTCCLTPLPTNKNDPPWLMKADTRPFTRSLLAPKLWLKPLTRPHGSAEHSIYRAAEASFDSGSWHTT